MLLRSIQVGPIETNCYLLGEGGRCCLVDPGGDGPDILEMVRLSGLTLDAILLTHGHWDHHNGIGDVLEVYPDLPVYIHKDELFQGQEKTPHYFFPPAGDVRTVEDGDTIQAGGLTFRVLITPGHSAGSAVYLTEDVMIAGDTLFAGTCGRCDLPGGGLEKMMASLRRLAVLEGDYRVCPGHGHTSTLEEERRSNPYMRQAMREA